MTPDHIRSGFALLCAAMLPALSFAASPGAVVPVSVASAVQPQVQVLGQGQGRRILSSAEFAELRGEYRLQGGGSLVVGGARHRPVVELNDHAPLALLPVAPDRLVSADGRLQLAFRTHANGEVSGLTLHVTPDLL
jgi:hypothetical protein